MLAAFTDPDSYDQFLVEAVAHTAVFNPGEARLLLDKFRTGRGNHQDQARLFLAYRLADSDLDGAAKLVASTFDDRFRTGGYVGLAQLTAKKDPPRAWGLIDTAFAQLEPDPPGSARRIFFGDRALLAAAVAVAAKDLRYPDMAGAVARALADRSPLRELPPQMREGSVEQLADVLSLVDVAVARQVLATVGTPDEIARRVAEGDGNLFALTFTYPDRAPAVIDRLVKEVFSDKSGRPRVRVNRSGLVVPGGGVNFRRLVNALTAGDRFGARVDYLLPGSNDRLEE
jgi:hypothetical protein